MVADSKEELLQMARNIGLNTKWIQDEGTWQEHFDVSLTMKKKAIALGAQEITMMQLGRMIAKRPGSPFNTDKKND
jgi:hypothetical protein